MSQMTGGDAVYHALKAAGVACVFGIPSQHNLGIYDALRRHGDIRVIGARHEQGAVHAADGYARATGRLGVAIVSTGPGTANAMNGLYEAGFASSPVLLITTQIDTIWLGKGKGFIHEAGQQLAMLRTVTRSSRTVRHVGDIIPALLQVMADILDGRPQPGAVEIPTDLLLASLPHSAPDWQPPLPLPPDAAALDQASALLRQSRRPLVWVGGGCQGAAHEVRALAEYLGAPVVSTTNGRGVIPDGHRLYVGNQTRLPAFRHLLEAADLVLAIGTRFQALATQYWQLPMPPLLHLDIDPGVIGRNYPAQLALIGDAGLGAAGLLERLQTASARPIVEDDFLALANATGKRLTAAVAQMIGKDHRHIVASIDALWPPDGPIVNDATIPANTWGNFLLPVRAPRIAHSSTSLAIGPALPLGIGAALGSGRKTLVIHGDGGMMLNLGELATAVDHCAPVVVCVFNDGGYGVLKALQYRATGHAYAVDLHTPDFVALAAAMGMPGAKVTTADDFAPALRTALAIDGPYLIEIDLKALEPIKMLG